MLEAINPNILQYLLQQAPVVVFLGLVIYTLYKQYLKKDEQVSQLSEEVVKLAALWESKAEKLDDKAHKEKVLELLREIKQLCGN